MTQGDVGVGGGYEMFAWVLFLHNITDRKQKRACFNLVVNHTERRRQPALVVKKKKRLHYVTTVLSQVVSREVIGIVGLFGRALVTIHHPTVERGK